VNEELVKQLFIHVVIGFGISVLFIVVSAIIQKTWLWIDDNDQVWDNYFLVLYLKARGYTKKYSGNNYYYTEKLIDEEKLSLTDAFIAQLWIGMGIGILVWLYKYFFMVAIVIMVLIGILFLTRYVRRLHKKLDAHLVNHK
jgi:F0F1-type ATP synthase assembly protein I